MMAEAASKRGLSCVALPRRAVEVVVSGIGKNGKKENDRNKKKGVFDVFY